MSENLAVARLFSSHLPAQQSAKATLNWWLGQLRSFLPEALQHRLRNSQTQLLLTLDDEQVNAEFQQGNSTDCVVISSTTDDRQLRARISSASHIILQIPREQVLCKTLQLPSAAADNLLDMLGFEMDRLTPFTAEQVYYDAHIVSQNTSEEILSARFAVVKKEVVDELMQRLASLGIQPHIACPAALPAPATNTQKTWQQSTTEFNLLPPEQRAVHKELIRRWKLSALALCLLCAVLLFPLWHLQNLSENLKQDIEEIRTAAQQSGDLLQAQQQLEEQIHTIVAEKNQRLALVEILRELTSLLPKNTWINRFEYRKTQLKLHGESSTASHLIALLENSVLFTDAAFDSPVTRNIRTGKERFILTVVVAQTADSSMENTP